MSEHLPNRRYQVRRLLATTPRTARADWTPERRLLRRRTEVVRVRLEGRLLAELDDWIARQPEKADRAEAIRAMVSAVLEVVNMRDEDDRPRS